MSELGKTAVVQKLTTLAEETVTRRVGVDAIYLPSWSRYLNVGGERFLRRVYTAVELEQAEGEPERLASRFAGKEAVLKVLGTGIEGVGMGAVEIACEEGGRPQVRLRDAAAEIAKALNLSAFEVSLCHEEDYALAVAAASMGRSEQ